MHLDPVDCRFARSENSCSTDDEPVLHENPYLDLFAFAVMLMTSSAIAPEHLCECFRQEDEAIQGPEEHNLFGLSWKRAITCRRGWCLSRGNLQLLLQYVHGPVRGCVCFTIDLKWRGFFVWLTSSVWGIDTCIPICGMSTSIS